MKKSSSTPVRRAQGGTLVGFVVGLLVGLAAALAVAVYVTRVPVPFVDRGLSRSAEDDAKEAERNKGWNPNGAATGVPAGTTPVPAPAAPQPSAPGAPGAPGAPATGAAPAGTGPTADPLGDLVNSRLGQGGAAAPAVAPAASATPAKPAAGPTAPGATAAPGADPFTYFVQAGAFRSSADAEAQRARLAMLGIAAEVSEREQNGRTVFRVRVGPFAQKPLADLTIEQLQANGVEAALVRVQR